MKKSLPSLNSIRFFECAARHRSFTRAGEELFVTQGAVSKQIKLLEEQLGVPLFARKGPYLNLTKHGERLYATVSTALELIEHGVGSLQSLASSNLTVTVLPSFASLWLMPRMGQFEARHPGLSIRLASSYLTVDFSVEKDIDMGIRLGRGQWPGLHASQITRDLMFPVCTPDLARCIEKPGDLNQHTLLVDPLPYDEWRQWFEHLELPYEIMDSKFYDDTGTQLRAAIEGKGISLAREELVQEYLDSGMLRRLFDIEYYSPLHYYCVCLESRKDEEYIALFRNWLEQSSSLEGR